MKHPTTSRAWLAKLVSFDTTSRNSNLELILNLQDWFVANGLTPRLTHNTKDKKANLFATLPAFDGNTHGGLILSGHTDVVPVDGQVWNTDPFVATTINDRIYGRGTTDMKGFIATTLALLPEFKKMRLSKPLHFAFSYDEEVGCHGAVHLIEDILMQGIEPDACIVGEPTSMQLIVAHKGINLFRCRIHGNAKHSSLTSEGCNAIEYAALLIGWIRQFADKVREKGPKDNHFDVPFTTLSTNLIQGGNAFNTIPALCEFFFEFRNLPTTHRASITDAINEYIQNDLLPKMRSEYPEAKIELDALAAVPSFEAAEDAHITQILRKLTGHTQISKVAYATEAGLFQQAGIPTILCGPGSIEQAHGANEYISLEQLEKCESFLRDLMTQYYCL
ncbi:MAG: acetylornithine deacetylase [Gammaproteobacteria bacterium]|nr:acetylornithine deacetylase [Gammaproteobacteria bacterium]